MISINTGAVARVAAPGALAVLLLVASCAAGARDLHLTVATTHPPTLPWVSVIRDHVMPELVAGLAAQRPAIHLTWTPAFGTLYKWHDSLAGVESGLADIGWVGSLWESSRLPLQNVTYALPFITDDLPALLTAINRLHDEMPALRASWEKYGAHFLGASGVDTYHLLTTFPVRSLDDLAGRRILAPGAAATWLRGTGAIAVDGALSSYYTQLRTGVADGVLSILTGAHPFRIHEVAPYVTLVGIGAQCTGALVANRDAWQALPGAARSLLTRLGREYSAIAAAEVVARYDRALAALAADGAHIVTLPAAEKQRWIDGLPPLAVEWVARNEARGLPARAMLGALMAALRAAGVDPVHDWEQGLGP
ncbi:MAG: C4-dicarboxylate TRAP transporter substrate-binding protein [Gammaproteobacteria bacterium]